MIENKKNTSIRLKEYMQMNNLKQVDILNKAQPYCKKYNIKLTKQDLSQYVSGKVEPAQRKLSILALALNVNEAWLMGFDVPMEKSKQLNNINEEQELLEKFNKLSESQQKQLINYAEFLLQQQKDK